MFGHIFVSEDLVYEAVFKNAAGDKCMSGRVYRLVYRSEIWKPARHTPEQVCKFQTKCNNDSRIKTFPGDLDLSHTYWVCFTGRGRRQKPLINHSFSQNDHPADPNVPKMVSMSGSSDTDVTSCCRTRSASRPHLVRKH